jgi:hypothetical protein
MNTKIAENNGAANYSYSSGDRYEERKRRKKCAAKLFVELAAEACHDDIEVRLQGAQVIVGLRIDLVQEAVIEIGCIHHLGTKRENTVGDGNVDVCSLLDDAGDWKRK